MLFNIFVALYAVIAVVFLDNTLREGQTIGAGRWDMMRLIGIAACSIWPLLVAYAIIVALRGRLPQSGRWML
ncbi:hypothetical protein SAMN04487976_12037 [Xaviernesmea oryzae]|nr:hypothetical protein SAMN04487976_12037 [Xaviernesmea oryzae]